MNIHIGVTCYAAKARNADSHELLANADAAGNMPTLLSMRGCINAALTSKFPQLVAMSSTMGLQNEQLASERQALSQSLLRRNLEVCLR
jgi:hypothetical protein